MDDLERIVEDVASDDAITGAIITSGKETFSGGADLSMLQTLLASFAPLAAAQGHEAAVQRLFAECGRLGRIFRRMEKAGKTVVAAINGTCVGGAFEMALACHARFVADDDKTKLGLPEVRVGLMPGAGGSQRVARLTGPEDGLKMLLQGEQLSPQRAKAIGLVTDVVPRGELIAVAKMWLRETPRAVQPWDEDGFRPPGGKVYSPAGFNVFPAAVALYRRETNDNYPGIRNTLKAFVEGLQVPFDTALRIEQRYFTEVLQSKEAAAMVRSLFVSTQELNKLARRPTTVPVAPIRRVGIVGAGFMGAGIAAASALAGIEVTLIDQNEATTAKGKATVAADLGKWVARGRLAQDAADAALARIHPTTDYAALADVDLVVEAVFEDRTVKESVIRRVDEVLPKHATFGSNTSTLPIASLAAQSKRPASFIGIHFFSPVDRMMLVEVIRAKKTGDAALARALDFVRALKKTPIVVNDSRGFYTSRVVTTYIGEGHRMLLEGVPAAMVENAGRFAGMPVGPLALNDEVAVDLTLRIMDAPRADVGEDAVPADQYRLVHELVVKRGRLGRKSGKGFYDYPDAPGGKKRLWSGLADIVKPVADPDTVDFGELKRRLLVIQALETARCFEDGVLTDVREADVGSILGFGFAPFTGGTLSYIDGMGADAFVGLCKRFAKLYGPRFKPNRLLRDMAKRGDTFYRLFPPAAVTRAA
jgi:3-hydroxyacyl-CoA dehydrogenase/enoyl-CoA hydratase/3-hydroxybutyryl-CoA epimerase